MELAIESYASLREIADTDDMLDLAWTLDERRLLRPDPLDIAVAELRAEVAAGLTYLAHYFVDDPFGARHLGPALLDSLGLSGRDVATFAGAGVGPMLAALAGHCRGGTALLAGSSYPDFPVWVRRVGGAVAWLDPRAGPDALAARITRSPPAIFFLEHPQFFSRDAEGRAALVALIEAASAKLGADALIVVDESNANYAPVDASLAALCDRTPGLVVLRGFSKAFQLGGLRLGLACAGAAAAPPVARLLPPLLASAISIRIGAALLRLADPVAPLRARIAEARPIAAALFEQGGIAMGPQANPLLPYLLLEPDSPAVVALEARGIRGKRHRYWSAAGAASVYRLSVPLDPARLSMLEDRLAATGGQEKA